MHMIIKIADTTRTVTRPESVYAILTEFMRRQDVVDQDKEHFFCIHLNNRNRIKLLELVSLGTLNASLVHPREVFTRAVRERSAMLIVAHNHPSGEVEPSDEDIQLTQRLREAGTLLGIELMDHVIISKGDYYSFKEKGML
jgi:DNA repair protein RadC